MIRLRAILRGNDCSAYRLSFFRSRKVNAGGHGGVEVRHSAETHCLPQFPGGQTTTMQATVDIDASVGGTEGEDSRLPGNPRLHPWRGNPAMLRMIGLMPVVRNRALTW